LLPYEGPDGADAGRLFSFIEERELFITEKEERL
jgi:hypothetical protein